MAPNGPLVGGSRRSARHLHALEKQVWGELLRQLGLPPRTLSHHLVRRGDARRRDRVWVPRGIIEYRMLEGDTGETIGGHWCGERYEAASSRTARFYPRRLLPRPNRNRHRRRACPADHECFSVPY